MNNLRNIKILLKSTLMKDPEIELQVKHNKKNIIYLDEDEDKEEESHCKCKGSRLRSLSQAMKQQYPYGFKKEPGL